MGPRYSIIPGDFATDTRADVNHFRVLNLIGRHTNAHGWCRLKQDNIAQALGLARETVNRKLKDLVDWGYVEKRAIDATGRAIFYRTVMDRHAPPSVVADDDETQFLDVGPPRAPVSGASHVGYNADAPAETELHPTCEEQITSGVTPRVTPGVIIGSHNKNDPSLTTKSPPNPPEGGASAQAADWKCTALGTLRGENRYGNAIDDLIAPLLASSHRLSLGKDALAELRGLAEAAAGLSVEALAAAVRRLNAQPKKLTALRIRREIDVARRVGAMVVIKRGTPQWQRWMEHYRDADPALAKFLATRDVTQVPSEWPPSSRASGTTAKERGAA